MEGPNGSAMVPFSNVETAKQTGYKLAGASVLTPSEVDDEARYNKDRTYGAGVDRAVGTVSAGALKSAVQIPNTIANYFDRITGSMQHAAESKAAASGHPVHFERQDVEPSLRAGEEAIAPGVTEPLHGVGEHVGGLAETLAEWLYGEGEARSAFEALPMSQRMTKLAQTVGFIEKNPAIGKAVSEGLRAKALRLAAQSGATAAGAGVQTIAHGGTPEEAAEAAAIGGGATGLLGAVGGAGKAILEHAAQPSATADAVTETARQAAADRIAATNETRTVAPQPGGSDYQFKIGGPPTRDTTAGSIAQDPQKVQVGHRVLEGKGPTERQVYPPPDAPETRADFVDINKGDPNAPGNHRSPIYRLTEDSKPGSVTKTDTAAGGGVLLTKDVGVASAHMQSLDRILADPDLATEQRAGYQAQRDDIQQQIGEYYKHQKAAQGSPPAIGPPSQVQTAFKPIDAKAVLDATGSPRDAAQQLRQAGAEVYDHANNVSGGQWQTLDKTITDLSKQLSDEPNIPSNRTTRVNLQRQIGEAQTAMDKILDEPRNGFDANDALQAKKNFHTAFVLQDMHDAISPIYDIEMHQPLVSGQYKGFNGNQLAQRWKAFLDDRPEARQVLGSDRVDTLTRLFDANKTMAGRKRFGQAVLTLGAAVAGGLHGGGLGAMEGAGGYQAIRYVLDGLISTPRVAKSLLFAIDSGARPENYAPGLARMIADKTLTAGRKLGAAAIPVAAGAVARADDKGGADEPTPKTNGSAAPAPAAPAPEKPQLTFDAGPDAGKSIDGMIERGNIDVNHRPSIKNADGSHSSIFSMTVPIGADNRPLPWGDPKVRAYALVPSIASGKFLTPDGNMPAKGDKKALEKLEARATDYYDKTGQHLGIFATEQAANKYANATHAYGNDGSDRKVFAPSMGGK